MREFDGELDPTPKAFDGEMDAEPAKSEPPKPEPQKAPDPIEVKVEAPAIEDAVQSIDRYAGKADALAQSNYLLLTSIKRLVEQMPKTDAQPRKWDFKIQRDEQFRMVGITAEAK